MIQYALAHPWILALLGIPAMLSSLPHLLHKGEVAAIRRLLATRDPIDQKAIKATISAWVTWAEEKYGAGQGPIKFAMVDAVLAKVLPFMSADDRQKLIEDAAKELDSGAHEATQ